ncbi:MAG: hypothetical protein R3E87_15100 [Burkholderiaceae bacterium]
MNPHGFIERALSDDELMRYTGQLSGERLEARLGTPSIMEAIAAIKRRLDSAPLDTAAIFRTLDAVDDAVSEARRATPAKLKDAIDDIAESLESLRHELTELTTTYDYEIDAAINETENLEADQ